MKIVGLPFIGPNAIVSQGRNGLYSHKRWSKTLDLSNAVDFEVPLGTSVIAVEDGNVAIFVDQSTEYYVGEDPKIGLRPLTVNFIILEHDDETYSVYSHLAFRGVKVERGQRVEKGQVIAETGLSGWIGGTRLVPHLHFQMYEFNKDHSISSIPVEFEGYSGSLEDFELRRFREIE